MKAVKGKLLKKLKTIKPVGYLKPDRVLQVFAMDGFVDSGQTTTITNVPEKHKLSCTEPETGQKQMKESILTVQERDVIDVGELMKDLEEEDMDLDVELNDKENVRPQCTVGENVKAPAKKESGCRCLLSEVDILSFRKPDLDSCTLFDPNLLAAFRQAVMEHVQTSEAERRARIEEVRREQEWPEEREPPFKTRRIGDSGDENRPESDPLLEFEKKCPPGGDGAVILYTTTLTGIRKTFEDCNNARFLLQSSRVSFMERDVSMHREYREELWSVLGFKAVPPRLFIKGRYIGGADEVLTLNEQGKLKLLLQGIQLKNRSDGGCEVCFEVRFVLCSECNGSSHRIAAEGDGSEKCPDCNENGLRICPSCC